MDGANAVQKIFQNNSSIYKGNDYFVLVTSLIASFQAFDQIRVMTSGAGQDNGGNGVLYFPVGI